MKTTLLVLLALVLIVAVVAGCKTSRAGYESAPYRVVRQSGAFEVRDYEALVLAETAAGANGADMNGGFGRLFRYITGRNATQAKIAMTTPVFVTRTNSEATMAFVMPARMKLTELPSPGDQGVQLHARDAARYAVLRFSGTRRSQTEAKAVTALQQRLQEEKLAALSEPQFAYYDPPWTPGFLRRNEVLVRVKAD